MQFRMARLSFPARSVFTACLTLVTASLLAAPPGGTASKRGLKKRPSHTAAETPVPAPIQTAPHEGDAHPVYADAWPSEYRPAATDLLLRADDERKAVALAQFAQGLVAEDNADPDGMLAGYRRAVELDPTNAELAVKVAYELARRNDVSAGIQVLKDTIKAVPKEPLPYIYLSQLYSTYLKKPDLALNYAKQALQLAPGNFKSHLALYELYRTGGQQKEAEAVIERAIQSEHRDAEFWVELGEHLRKLHLKDDGTSMPDELHRMNIVYEKLAGVGESDAAILGKVADYYVLSKQVPKAIPYYQKVLKLRPGMNDQIASEVREKLARSLLFNQQRDEAIEIFEQIAKEFPQRFETFELLGELYEQKGDLDRALQYYQHTLSLDASEPRNHIRLANLLREAKKYDKAVEMLEQARKKFPDLPFITYGLALSLSQAARHDEALSMFAQAQSDAEMRNEEMLNAGFYFTYGAAAEQAGKYDKAAELLKQSIELDPNASQAYNYLGYMWVDRNERLDEAGELIKKAVEIEPENGAYLDSLGWYYFKKGDTERALKELLRAQENILREQKTDDATVLDHIADAYAKLGKTVEALGYWQKALALQPEDQKLATRIAEKLEATKQKMTAAPPAPMPPAPEPPKP